MHTGIQASSGTVLTKFRFPRDRVGRHVYPGHSESPRPSYTQSKVRPSEIWACLSQTSKKVNCQRPWNHDTHVLQQAGTVILRARGWWVKVTNRTTTSLRELKLSKSIYPTTSNKHQSKINLWCSLSPPSCALAWLENIGQAQLRSQTDPHTHIHTDACKTVCAPADLLAHARSKVPLTPHVDRMAENIDYPGAGTCLQLTETKRMPGQHAYTKHLLGRCHSKAQIRASVDQIKTDTLIIFVWLNLRRHKQ